MALSKKYTLKLFRQLVLSFIQKELEDEIGPEVVDELINLAVYDTAVKISSAKIPDYETRVVVSVDETAKSLASKGTGVFTNSTKNIADTGHGLTSADVGKLITYWATNYITNGTIVSITDEDNFIVSAALGESGAVSYIVSAAVTDDTIDLSGYEVDHIKYIEDVTNGRFIPIKESEADTIKSQVIKTSKVHYYISGETAFLVRGSALSTYGVVTLCYQRLPEQPGSDTDYIDVRDKFIPLAIKYTKAYCYEYVGKTAPEVLTASINNDLQQIAGADIKNKKDSATAK